MLAITRVMEQYLDPKTNPVISEKDNKMNRSQLLRASRVDWRRWLYIYAWGRLIGLT